MYNLCASISIIKSIMPNTPTATLAVTPFNLLTHSPIGSPSNPFALNAFNGLLLTVSVSVCGAALSFSPISLSYSVSGSLAVGVYPCDSLGNALSQTPLPESSPEHIVADMYRHGLSLASEVPCADGTHYFIILGSGSVPLTGLYRTKMSHAFRPALTDENAYIKAERPLVADYPIGPASLSADLGHGRHSLSMPLLSISNDLHEFALSAVWLSHCRTETAYGPSALPTGLPAGWKWSFQRWLLPNGSEYALVDASGLRHRFVRPDNADAPPGVYFDPSGTRLILTVGASQSVIEGPSGDRLVFDASGNLAEVRVRKGSEYATQTIAYSDGLPATLSLSDDVAITFVYGASSVTAQSTSGEAVSLAWSSAGVQATDAAGISASAAFDTAGSLSSVSSGQLSMALSYSNGLLSSVSLGDLSQNPLRQASFSRDGSVIRVSTTLHGSSATQTVKAFLLGQDGGIGSSWEEIGGRIENLDSRFQDGNEEREFLTGGRRWDYSLSGPFSVGTSETTQLLALSSGFPHGFVYMEYLVSQPNPSGETTMKVWATAAGGGGSREFSLEASTDYRPIALPFEATGAGASVNLTITMKVTSSSGAVSVRHVRYYRSADPVSEDCSDAVNGAASFPAEGDFPSLYPLGTLPFSYYDSSSAQITGSARFSKGDVAASIVWNGSHPSEILLWSDEGSVLRYKVSSPVISGRPISAILCALVEKCHSWGQTGDVVSISAQYLQAESENGFSTHRFSKDGEYNAVAKEDRAFSQNLVALWSSDPLADLRETYETDVWGHLLWTETKHHPGQSNEKVRLSEQKTISDDGRHATSVATPISGSASRTDSYTYSDISDVTSSKIGGLLAVSASYLSGHLLSSVTQTAGENGPAFSNALGYSGGELYSMTTGGQTTLLARDAEGNVSSVSRDNSQIASYSVSADSIGRIVRATSWANGSSTVERFDRHGRKESLAVDGTERASWVYEDPGTPIGGVPSSAAPLKGIGYKPHQGSSYLNRLYQYDAYGRESSITEGTVSLSYIRPTIPPDEVTGFDFACDRVELRDSGVLQRAEIVGEAFGASAQQGRFRKTMLNGKNTFEQTRSWSFPDDMTSEIVVTNGALNVEGQYYRELDFFRIAGSKFTGFVESESFEYGVGGPSLGERHMTYSWNGNGMLSGISSPSNGGYGFSQSFSYDSYGRLAGETNALGITYSYTYDSRGNVTSKFYEVAGWPVGSLRTYDSKDRLTAMTDFPGANAFSYDASGYPTRYKNKDVSWDGPMMTAYGSASYAYDGLGRLRAISDPSRSVSLSYAPDDRLMRMAVSASNATYQLDFIYGTDGIVGFMIGSDVYIYHKNILGDVVAIYKNGILQAQYRYDAWGNCLVLNASGVPDTSASSVGNLNPFRYRGAFYDASSGLYLMGSRPYDPDVGRFICPDDPSYLDPTKIGGLNLYAYCLNNPVMYGDTNGHTPLFLLLTFIVGFAIGIGISAYLDYQNDGLLFNGGEGDPRWYDYLSMGLTVGVFALGLGYLSTMSWTIHLPTLGAFFSRGMLLATAIPITISINGSTIAGAIGGIALGSIMMFSKGAGPRSGHNQYENGQIDDLCRKHHLTMDERKRLHNIIRHQNLTFQEIEELIWDIFRK